MKGRKPASVALVCVGLFAVVLNGCARDGAAYGVDGVKYLVLGGGGAEQHPILP